jgi:hypothetical protein
MNLYRLLDAGAIATVTVGRRRYVTDNELRRYVARLEGEAS